MTQLERKMLTELLRKAMSNTQNTKEIKAFKEAINVNQTSVTHEALVINQN